MEQQNRIVGIAGRKGSGKSTIAQMIMTQCDRLFLFDTMGEHVWIPERQETQDEATIALLETQARETFWISTIPQGDDAEDEFNQVCSDVYDMGNLTFAVEEVPMLGCTPNYTPRKFNKIVRLGRHHNISVIYTAQRLGECPRALTSATDVFVLFCHTEPRDLDAISERCGPEIARKVTDLGDHGFLVWDVLSREEINVVDKQWYIRIAQPKSQPTGANDAQ